MSGIIGESLAEGFFDIGNSSTAFDVDLANDGVQQITMTASATATFISPPNDGVYALTL